LSAPPVSTPAADTAAALLDAAAAPPVAADQVRAVAWALKALCYEAWGREPTRAARAAERLRELQAGGVPAADATEVGALADWTEGIAHTTRGRMADALACFDRAESGLRRAGLPDPAAQTQVPKIMALSMLGRHDEAAQCAERAQQELLALGNVAAASRVSLNLGAAQLRRDLYAESARHYRAAAVLFARIGDHGQSVLADIGMADALAAQGEFDEALMIYERARMRAQQRGFEVPVALVDESVALVELARGRYREALAGLESARRHYQRLALPQHLAIAEKQLADAYLELRLMPEALALYAAAIDKFRELDLPDEQAWALAQQGRAAAATEPTDAAASFDRAALLFEAQHNEAGRSAVALARAELALAHGDAAAALTQAERAAAGFARARHGDGRARAEVVRAEALLATGDAADAGAAFAATLERARASRQLAVQVRCLGALARLAIGAGDPARARTLLREAIELFEAQRRALPGDELRIAFLGGNLRPYLDLLRLALADGDPVAVLRELERFRARALDERLAAGSPPDADAPLADLRPRLNWLYRRARRQLEESEPSAALDAQILHLEQELLEQARRHRLAAPVEAAPEGEALGVEALQAALEPGDALVEYGVLDDELFACVVTARGVRLLRRVAGWASAAQALGAVRFQLEALQHGAAPLQRHLATLAARAETRLHQVHALVWAPLAEAVADCRRIVVVPHGPLAMLPFAALGGGGPRLGEQVELAFAPSARLALRGLQRQPVPARCAVALGESSQLAHAAAEAQAVAALYPAGEAHVGAQASLQTLQRRAAAADVLHLACHAQFRGDNPRFSALHLHDGALTVERAESLALKPAIVVLSACDTAQGEQGQGDEMVGLVRAFLTAGAARVVASLWPVDDAVTSVFMTAFHTALAGGQGAAAALRLAQAEVARTHPHPSAWAAFVLYGGW
jgi:CHAT domain-containing protein/tetratricopeptide (TPR) repeat protein